MTETPDRGVSTPVPGRWCAGPGDRQEPERGPLTQVSRDAVTWPLATAADVAWIIEGTRPGTTITCAIPAGFGAYATVVLPQDTRDQQRHDDALLAVLRAHGDDSWWLGYLDTGADDVVFPEAPRVRLYSDWPYVLVQAGPAQAARWRRWEQGSFWPGRLPNLMFPADRRWMVSTLWDDDWTCVGGSAGLVDDLLGHPVLRDRARRVELGVDATPPGHSAG